MQMLGEKQTKKNPIYSTFKSNPLANSSLLRLQREQLEGAVGDADAPRRPPALQPALQSPCQPEAATEAPKQQPFISAVCTFISALCCLSIWLFLYYRELQQKLEILGEKFVNETNPALMRREASV